MEDCSHSEDAGVRCSGPDISRSCIKPENCQEKTDFSSLGVVTLGSVESAVFVPLAKTILNTVQAALKVREQFCVMMWRVNPRSLEQKELHENLGGVD